MCKYCDSLKEKSLVSYDNYKSMNISYGQYQGVNVRGSVYMQGNMLSIGCSGSYRSQSDCYYDAEGLDCDNENSYDSEPNYIQILYCPFCGKKLEDHTYEKQKANDDIKKLKDKLEWLEQDLRDYSLIITCHWYCNKRVLHNVEVWPGKFGDRTEYDYIEYDNDNPLNIKEISEIFPKVSINIYYGCPQKAWNKCILIDLPEFTLNTKMRCVGYYNGEYHSNDYQITDEMYFKLVELGYIEKNDNELNNLHKRQSKIKEEIKQIKLKIKELNNYIKQLKNEK